MKDNIERARTWILDLTLISCLISQVIAGNWTWPNVGFIFTLCLIWTPHAYFRFITHRDSHSVFQNKKKIESLTSSLNLLSAKLNEVEKLAKHQDICQAHAVRGTPARGKGDWLEAKSLFVANEGKGQLRERKQQWSGQGCNQCAW